MTQAREIHKNNIPIGSGEIFIDLEDADGGLTGERYVGDSEGGTLTITTERLTVFSGDGATAQKLVDTVTSIERSLGLVLRDISPENMALFIQGEVGDIAAMTAAVMDEVIPGVLRGRWYQLGRTDANPAGVSQITDAAVAMGTQNAAGPPPTFVAGTEALADANLDIDRGTGRIRIKPNAPDVTDGEAIQIDYTPDAPARKSIQTGTPRNILAAMRYVESKPGSNPNARAVNYYARRCNIQPGGDLAQKSRTDPQRITLSCQMLDPGGGLAELYIDGEPQE